jgi:hypothetical protein
VRITLNTEDSQFLYTVLGNNALGKLTVNKNSHRINRFCICWIYVGRNIKYKHAKLLKVYNFVKSKQKLL